MAVFSSIERTTAFSGGDKYSPHTSAARSQNSGVSLRFSQPFTRWGFTSRSDRMRPTWLAEMPMPASAIAAASVECDHWASTSGRSSVALALSTSRSVGP